MNLLLTNKNTRVFNVDLAKAIGLNEAIVLQQIQYWIEVKESEKEKYQDAFHDGYVWVYNTFNDWNEQLPFWCIRTLKTIFKNLETKGILVVGNYNKFGYDKKKWYRIDYDRLEEIVAETLEGNHSAKIAPTKVQKLHDGKCQDCTTNSKDYIPENTTDTSENIKWNFSEKNPVSLEILERHIEKCLKFIGFSNEEAKKEIIHIVQYYYMKYKEVFSKEHPILSTSAMEDMLRKLTNGTDMVDIIDSDIYEVLIDKHFETHYENCDYNICHFMTEGIRNNRYYEELY